MTKTNSKKTATNAAARSSQRRTLESGDIASWLSSNNTRPKKVVLTLQRTTEGYTVEHATILNRTNQYSVNPVSVPARALVEDIQNRGFVF